MSSNLDVYLLTFNCGRTLVKPEAFASHFFDALPEETRSTGQQQPPHLIVLHLQEIAPIAEAFNGHALPQYYERFTHAVHLAVERRFSDAAGSFGKDTYVDFTTGNAGMTAIMIFARTDVQHSIEDVMSAGVGVGVQKMGNKGAVGVRFAWRLEGTESLGSSAATMNKMYLTFVAAHLAPFEEAVERRDQDYKDIVAGLVFERKGKSQQRTRTSDEGQDNEEEEEGAPLLSSSTSPGSSTDLIGMYAPDTHVFFAGDLNYRTSSTRPVHDGTDVSSFPQPTSNRSDPRHWSHLLARDQLTGQLRAGHTLHGLTESPITFPPTYKYDTPKACDGNKDVVLDSEVTEWKWSTHRWPSWCDRILYSSSPSPSSEETATSTSMSVGSYTSLPLLSTSDHRPVALSVSIPLRPVHNPDFASRRPVDLDRNWRANRDSALWKERVLGTVWSGVTAVGLDTSAGGLNVAVGLATVVCIAVLATVYAQDW